MFSKDKSRIVEVMRIVTLCFLTRSDEILLAQKKKGFGGGKWNGYGGGLEDGETILQAACREVKEESGALIDSGDLQKRAEIEFYFGDDLRIYCHVFIAKHWQGKPTESEEMGEPQWFKIENFPYDEMWAADAKWIPEIVKGRSIKAVVRFNSTGDTLHGMYIEDTVLS